MNKDKNLLEIENKVLGMIPSQIAEKNDPLKISDWVEVGDKSNTDICENNT